MTEAAAEIQIHDIRIAGIPGRHVVAKVQRISSPPVAVDAVTDPHRSALLRLADVFRGGASTRAFEDFRAFKQRLQEEPHEEWDRCVAKVCQALGLERLEPLELAQLPVCGSGAPPSVTYHLAEMNGRDYVVARVGTILGGPAALALLADPAISGLDRLADVMRAGDGSQCFNDFLAGGPIAKRSNEWKFNGSLVGLEQVIRQGVGPSRNQWIRDSDLVVGGLCRYQRRSPADRLRPTVMLDDGDVVRVAGGPARSPSGGSVVQIVDRETGAELGVVSEASLRPL